MSCNTEFSAGEYPLTRHFRGGWRRHERPPRPAGGPATPTPGARSSTAAKRVFAAKGYDGTSLRAVAREAGVDPALVHHYFDGKASLFVAAMALPFDPRQVKEHAAAARVLGAPAPSSRFLTMWDHAEGSGSSFASCVAAMAASTNVADAIREFVTERVWARSPVQRGRERGRDQAPRPPWSPRS